MPKKPRMTIDDHLDRMEKNEEFFNKLLQEDDPHKDWIIIIEFYTALHGVDSVLLKLGASDYRLGKHESRNEEVDVRLPGKISKAYTNLFTMSIFLRYERPKNHTISEQSLNHYISTWNDVIKPYVLAEMGQTNL